MLNIIVIIDEFSWIMLNIIKYKLESMWGERQGKKKDIGL